MSLTEYVQGSSIEEPLTLTDSSGTALPISTLTDIWLRIFHCKTRDELTERTLLTSTLFIVDDDEGIIEPHITDIETQNIKMGLYCYELEAKIYDAEWSGNYKYIKQSGKYFIIKETVE